MAFCHLGCLQSCCFNIKYWWYMNILYCNISVNKNITVQLLSQEPPFCFAHLDGDLQTQDWYSIELGVMQL